MGAIILEESLFPMRREEAAYKLIAQLRVDSVDEPLIFQDWENEGLFRET